MGETHVNSLRRVEDARVSYVCDIDPAKGKPLAQSAGAGYISDFSELLSKEVDIIDVCLPTPLHRPFAVKALEAGFHLFLEKPLAINMEEAEAIHRAASKSSALSMVGHVLRFWPGYAELHDRIEAGEIGPPRHILAYRVGPPPGWAAWYMDMKKSNGVIFDLGIHDIDYVRWVMGQPKAVYSQAYEREGVHIHGQVLLDYGHGEALCECSWAGSATFPFTSYIEVAGPGGLAHVDGRANNAFASLHPDRAIRLDPYQEDGYVKELRHFVECVRDGRKPMVPISEALETIRLSLAAMESAKTTRRVSLG
jgi:predicted dehydrogenase